MRTSVVLEWTESYPHGNIQRPQTRFELLSGKSSLLVHCDTFHETTNLHVFVHLCRVGTVDVNLLEQRESWLETSARSDVLQAVVDFRRICARLLLYLAKR
jgi:hypothetical protein